MKALLESPQEFADLNQELRNCISKLLSELQVEKRTARVRSDINFASDAEYQDSFIVLREGELIYQRSDKKIFSYEPGDLVAVERLFKSLPQVKISSSFPVTVDIYSADEFFAYLVENPRLLDIWSEILVLKLEVYASLISSFALVKLNNIQPKECIILSGNSIIKEGDIGNEVYCLLEGKANVSISGTKIGEIHKDEVFGVIAALGGVPRTATVTADSECRILVIDKTDFSELVKAKPEAFEKVMQDTARAIKDLNLKVSTLGPNKPMIEIY